MQGGGKRESKSMHTFSCQATLTRMHDDAGSGCHIVRHYHQLYRHYAGRFKDNIPWMKYHYNLHGRSTQLRASQFFACDTKLIEYEAIKNSFREISLPLSSLQSKGSWPEYLMKLRRACVRIHLHVLHILLVQQICTQNWEGCKCEHEEQKSDELATKKDTKY